MRNLVKLIIIAFALVLLSCHSEVPDFPGYPDAKYCKSPKFQSCKSIDDGDISEAECLAPVVGGTIVTGSCE
jgi:hypothetical protein